MGFTISHLSGGYGRGDVCKDITCSVEHGDILCVLGPNGCGKSTLFKLILGVLKKSTGDITLNGQSLCGLSDRDLARKVAYIPQQHTPTFSFTVLEMVLMGRTSHFGAFSMPNPSDTAQAMEALKRLDIAHLAQSNYMLLSGGQQQLVLIARAICQKSCVLIMDEPAANLDYANAQKVMSIIQSIAQDGYIVILSTHSPEQPFSWGSKVLLMKEGQGYAFGTPHAVLTVDTLHAVYGIHMDIVHVQDRNGNPRTLCLPLSSF